MNPRTKAVIRVLGISFLSAFSIAGLKLGFGKWSHSLAFVADGLHSIFDSLATVIGAISIIWSSKPPDEGHPYGHQKFETVSAISLAIIILLTSYEVGTLALERILSKNVATHYSNWGVLILLISMCANLCIAKLEVRMAKSVGSPFLLSDAAHNHADFWITTAVLSTIIASYYHLPDRKSVV